MIHYEVRYASLCPPLSDMLARHGLLASSPARTFLPKINQNKLTANPNMSGIFQRHQQE